MFRIKQILVNEFNFTLLKHHHLHNEYIQSPMCPLQIIVIIIIIIIIMNSKTKDTPLIKMSTGTTSKSFIKYMSNTSGKHEYKKLQNTVVLGTTHVFRNVLM
jgi:hypothetical protein